MGFGFILVEAAEEVDAFGGFFVVAGQEGAGGDEGQVVGGLWVLHETHDHRLLQILLEALEFLGVGHHLALLTYKGLSFLSSEVLHLADVLGFA